MAMPDRSREIAGLSESWRQWSNIVRLFAAREERRYAILPTEYLARHVELLTRCRAMAGRNDPDRREPDRHDPDRQSIYCELVDILTPWVNLESLARADREIACQLLERCRAAQQVLDGPLGARRIGQRLRGVLVATALVALACIALLLIYQSGPLSWPAAVAARRWFRRIQYAVARNTFQQRLLAGGAVALFATMAVVWSAAKKQ